MWPVSSALYDYRLQCSFFAATFKIFNFKYVFLLDYFGSFHQRKQLCISCMYHFFFDLTFTKVYTSICCLRFVSCFPCLLYFFISVSSPWWVFISVVIFFCRSHFSCEERAGLVNIQPISATDCIFLISPGLVCVSHHCWHSLPQFLLQSAAVTLTHLHGANKGQLCRSQPRLCGAFEAAPSPIFPPLVTPNEIPSIQLLFPCLLLRYLTSNIWHTLFFSHCCVHFRVQSIWVMLQSLKSGCGSAWLSDPWTTSYLLLISAALTHDVLGRGEPL